jgi:hypothetical protein
VHLLNPNRATDQGGCSADVGCRTCESPQSTFNTSSLLSSSLPFLTNHHISPLFPCLPRSPLPSSPLPLLLFLPLSSLLSSLNLLLLLLSPTPIFFFFFPFPSLPKLSSSYSSPSLFISHSPLFLLSPPLHSLSFLPPSSPPLPPFSTHLPLLLLPLPPSFSQSPSASFTSILFSSSPLS